MFRLANLLLFHLQFALLELTGPLWLGCRAYHLRRDLVHRCLVAPLCQKDARTSRSALSVHRPYAAMLIPVATTSVLLAQFFGLWSAGDGMRTESTIRLALVGAGAVHT